MEKREITARGDIGYLVSTFYIEVRKDPLLSPIFNKLISSDEMWGHHHKTLTDFWESNLLVAKSYSGHPDAIHFWVDMQANRTLTKDHFDRWLKLWYENIDKHFHGTVAENAKKRATAMGKTIFKKVIEARPSA